MLCLHKSGGSIYLIRNSFSAWCNPATCFTGCTSSSIRHTTTDETLNINKTKKKVLPVHTCNKAHDGLMFLAGVMVDINSNNHQVSLLKTEGHYISIHCNVTIPYFHMNLGLGDMEHFSYQSVSKYIVIEIRCPEMQEPKH